MITQILIHYFKLQWLMKGFDLRDINEVRLQVLPVSGTSLIH